MCQMTSYKLGPVVVIRVHCVITLCNVVIMLCNVWKYNASYFTSSSFESQIGMCSTEYSYGNCGHGVELHNNLI